MHQHLTSDSLSKLTADLAGLDKEKVFVNGNWLLPNQCYRFGTDPVHILYNTNCPEQLKTKIRAIFSKYGLEDESSS